MAHKWKIVAGSRVALEGGAAGLLLQVHVVDPDRADALVTMTSVQVPDGASKQEVREAVRAAARAAWDAYQQERAPIVALIGEEGTET